MKGENDKMGCISKISNYPSLMKEGKTILKNEGNENKLIHLVEQYQRLNKNSVIKIRAVSGMYLRELRAIDVARGYFQEKNDII